MSDIRTVKSLSGVDRTAAFLMVLKEREAADILTHMDPGEIYQIANSMSNLPSVNKEQVQEIIQSFFMSANDVSGLGSNDDASGHIRKLLILALGHERANEVISRIKLLDRRSGGLDALRRKDAREIADMVRSEHPQVTAIIMSFLQAAQAAAVLTHLSESMRQEVLIRVAKLEEVPVTATEEINSLIEAHFSDDILTTSTSSGLGGPKTAANILNLFEGSMQENAMDQIRNNDMELAEVIEENMLTFDDLSRLDDRSIQALLSEVNAKDLMLALKGIAEQSRERFLRNMSTRAADMMRDDLEISGPVRLSEVETAQKEVVTSARKLIDAGTIVLAGMGGGEELVY